MLEKIKKAFSLVEVILVVAVFMLIVLAFIQGVAGTPAILINSEDRLAARYYLQEGQEALRSMRDHDFAQLEAVVGSGDLGLSSANGYWEFSGVSDTYGQFTRTVSLISSSDDVVEATTTVSWVNVRGQSVSISSVTRLSNWQVSIASASWVINTTEQFEAGFLNSVEIGSITLGSIGDWADAALIERYALPGTSADPSARKVILKDDLLYHLSADQLTVFDVSDISRRSIREVDSYAFAKANDFLVHGDYVYLAMDSGNEIQILNRSDLSLAASYHYSDSNVATGLDLVDEDHLIFSSTQSGLSPQIFILNISDLNAITLDYSLNNLGADLKDVVVHEGYAYFASTNDSGELMVMRLSDHAVVNSLDLPGTANPNNIYIDAVNDQLYISRATSVDAELYRINISSPTGVLSSAASLNLSVDVNSAFEYQGDLYIATGNTAAEVQILDASTLVAQNTIDLQEGQPAGDVFVAGSFIYVSSFATSNELQIAMSATHQWYNPSVSETKDLAANIKARAIDVLGNFIYVAKEAVTTGVEFFVYEDTTGSLVSRGTLELGTRVNEIDANGNFAYMATGSDTGELMILNISNPNSPSIAGLFNHPSSGGVDGRSVLYAGNGVLYLGTDNDTAVPANKELTVYDVSNRNAPVRITDFNLNVIVHAMLINGTNLFLGTDGDTSEIMVFDITTPTAPVLTSTFDIPGNTRDVGAMAYRVSDNTLHLAFFGGGGYKAIDASNINNMSVLGTYGFNAGKESIQLSSDGKLVFISGLGEAGKQELNILDVEDPTDPIYIADLDMGDDAYDIRFSSDFSKVYVTTKVTTGELKSVGGTMPTLVHPNEGFWMSEAYNTGSPDTTLDSIEWTATEPVGTDVQFMVRSAQDSDLDDDCSDEMDSAIWVGLDGTNQSTFDTSPSEITPHAGASGGQCVQILAILEGTASATPEINEIILNYAP